MAKVQNTPAAVSNDVVELMVSETAQASTQKVFETLVRMEKVADLADDICAMLTAELKNASFMTVDLEISEEQRVKLLEVVQRATTTSRDRYIGNLKKDERTKALVQVVEQAMRNVVEEALSAIGAEINRGAIINSIAVAADAKKEDYNKLELQYSKSAGDITIPTKGVFISTNCIKVIQDSCAVVVPKTETDEAAAAKKTVVAKIGKDGVMRMVDADTGEVKE